MYIKHGSLGATNCKRGTRELVEHYRVLGIFSAFSKIYKKWWFHWENNTVIRDKKIEYKVLRRMAKKDGDMIAKDMECNKDGAWGSQFMCRIKYLQNIVSDDNTEVKILWWGVAWLGERLCCFGLL